VICSPLYIDTLQQKRGNKTTPNNDVNVKTQHTVLESTRTKVRTKRVINEKNQKREHDLLLYNEDHFTRPYTRLQINGRTCISRSRYVHNNVYNVYVHWSI